MADYRCYAQRRLAPFLGTVQVIEVSAGRALSYDGSVWHIQLRARDAITTPAWGGIGPGNTARPFFRYASWTADDELRRLPVNPVLGDVTAYPALQELLAALRQRPAVPFPLEDHYECWVLDNEGQPIVLFASACAENARNLPPHPRWQAGSQEAPAFQSAALAAADSALTMPHAAWLTEQLTRRVGTPLSLLWLYREADGSGVGIDGKHVRVEWARQVYPAAAFPPLLLREDWTDALSAAVVQDYLAWQSPYLLQLPTLGVAQRTALEQAASQWPAQLLSVRRLLPAVIDRELIDATLVRARLEQT